MSLYNPDSIKTIAALVIFAVSVLAGLGPLRKAKINPGHRLIELGEALGGGVFLGIGLFHMLPDAQQNLHAAFPHADYPYANLLCAMGFVLLLFLEKIVLQVSDDGHHHHKATTVPYVLPLVLSVHAFIEGAALGVNLSFANILIIFVAIIVHKGSESFALATNLGKSPLPLSRSIPIFLCWAVMSPLGVLAGSLAANTLQSNSGLVVAAVFNAFAAGTFLYIATLHKANHLCSSPHGGHFREFMVMLVGLSLMALVQIWM